MSKIKQYAVVTLILSVISIVALILSHLALTDINHGEQNLTLEWAILQVSAIIFLVFIVSTILTLIMVLKSGLLNSK